MALKSSEINLLIFTIIILIADIALAFCLTIILPKYITHRDWFLADGRKIPFPEATAVCPCLQLVFPEGSKEKIKFDKIPDKAVAKRSVDVTKKLLETYPFLVSLSSPVYPDEEKQKLFACNGLVESTQWLITTKNCVKNTKEWYDVAVRSQSPFWSIGGQEHKVIKVLPTTYNDLIRLKVAPNFSEAVVPSPPIQYTSVGNWSYAISIGWDDLMYEKDSEHRSKYNVFNVEEWSSKALRFGSTKVCRRSTKNVKLSSKFLLTNSHLLIGLQKTNTHKNDCLYNSFIAIDDRKEEEDCFSLYKRQGGINGTELCQN